MMDEILVGAVIFAAFGAMFLFGVLTVVRAAGGETPRERLEIAVLVFTLPILLVVVNWGLVVCRLWEWLKK